MRVYATTAESIGPVSGMKIEHVILEHTGNVLALKITKGPNLGRITLKTPKIQTRHSAAWMSQPFSPDTFTGICIVSNPRFTEPPS